MNNIIETGRLILRTFTIEDAPLFYNLNQDPEVVQYTLDKVRNIDHAKDIIEQIILPQYSLYNHGRWAIYTMYDLEFIGWCGLKFISERNEVDLGYRLKKSAWGKGYATEAAYASIDYGFKKIDLKRIVGRVLPQNQASIKVLEKCGMNYIGEEMIDGLLHKSYEIINPFYK